jgi:hypothetical protein
MRKRLLKTIPINLRGYYPKGAIFEVSSVLGQKGIYVLVKHLVVDMNFSGTPTAGWGYKDIKTKQLILFDELIEGEDYENLND